MTTDLNQKRLAAVERLGTGLFRPECVLATRSGSIYAADWNGGVTWLRPDGGQERILAADPAVDFKPNGFAMLEDGSFLVANISYDGGIWRLYRDGRLEPFVTMVEGKPLPASNFVLLDREGRVWITVSTRRCPRSLAYRPDVDDGFIVLVEDLDPSAARIVADGLGFTNEVALSADGAFLYVNETFIRRTSRFPVLPDGSLGPREDVARYGHGTYPDGLAIDADGALWITSIVSNRLIRVGPDGAQETFVEDVVPDHVEWIEAAYQAGGMDRPHMDSTPAKTIKGLSSLCFAGPDLKTMVMGCLLDEVIYRLPGSVAGLPPAHWDFPW